MKRYLSELNQDELMKVYEENSKLQHNVAEHYMENQMEWAGEYLDVLKPGLSDWSIGFCSHNKLTVEDAATKIYPAEGVVVEYV